MGGQALARPAAGLRIQTNW